MLPSFNKKTHKTKTQPQKLEKLKIYKYFSKSLSFCCTLLVLVSMHEVLNVIYNLWDAQIKVIKSVWMLPSGAHASPAELGPFLVVAHCWSRAAADKIVPCTANSFLTRQIDLLWLAAKHSMVKPAVH